MAYQLLCVCVCVCLKRDLALNNQQEMTCHENQSTNYSTDLIMLNFMIFLDIFFSVTDLLFSFVWLRCLIA